jgi:hypothetical protein
MDSIRVGSDEHRRLYCRMFVDSHKPFRPEDIVWPALDAEALARLKALPVWSEAVRTETATAVKVQTLGKAGFESWVFVDSRLKTQNSELRTR